MAFSRVCIVGVGLLGGSIGLAVRARIEGARVVGYGHRQSTLDKALECGAIDEAFTDAKLAVKNCDLVVLCTPVGLLEKMVDEIALALMPGAIVTDVGSTKRTIVAAGEAKLTKQIHFVGSHPMAGSEKRGVEFARTDLFENATCILTPTERTNVNALEKVEQFWSSLGMRTLRLSPTEHDQFLADISHLPHVIAAALVGIQQEGAIGLAGKGFMDSTRIAGGDGALWRDILLDNADNMRASITRITSELAKLQSLLSRDKSAELEKWLNDAAARREQLHRSKLKEINSD